MEFKKHPYIKKPTKELMDYPLKDRNLLLLESLELYGFTKNDYNIIDNHIIARGTNISEFKTHSEFWQWQENEPNKNNFNL